MEGEGEENERNKSVSEVWKRRIGFLEPAHSKMGMFVLRMGKQEVQRRRRWLFDNAN